jgi:hypothetical protein
LKAETFSGFRCKDGAKVPTFRKTLSDSKKPTPWMTSSFAIEAHFGSRVVGLQV